MEKSLPSILERFALCLGYGRSMPSLVVFSFFPSSAQPRNAFHKGNCNGAKGKGKYQNDDEVWDAFSERMPKQDAGIGIAEDYGIVHHEIDHAVFANIIDERHSWRRQCEKDS